MDVINAMIQKADIGFTDNGIITCWLNCSLGNFGSISYGFFTLDRYDESTNTRVGSEYGTQCIMDLLRVVGVKKFSELNGHAIRLKFDDGLKAGASVSAVGNFLTDDWFSFQKLYDAMNPSAESEAEGEPN